RGNLSLLRAWVFSTAATYSGRYEENVCATPPYISSVSYSNASFSNVAGGTLGLDPLGPNATSVLSLHATQLPANVPYSQPWNFDIQRQLPGGGVLEAGYHGSKSTHLLGIVDINEARPGAALAAGLHQANGNTIFTSTDQQRINAAPPYRGFGVINALRTGFDSNYHSLQVHLRKNFKRGGLIGIAYPWARTMTAASSDRSHWPQNTYDRRSEYAPAAFDRKHVLTANYVYTLPFFKRGHGFRNRAFGGWQL